MIHQVSKQVVEKVDLSDELSLHTEATNLNVLNGQMDYVKSHNDAVWVDTFLNVSLYTKEQAAAKLAVTSTGDHKADVLLTCSLDPTLYHYPLTVVVALPGVTQASATQGISSIPLILGKDSVQVDVVPGIEPTSVTWTDGK